MSKPNTGKAKAGCYSAYVRNKEMRQKATFRIREDGSTCYLFDGHELAVKDFEGAYPVGLIDRSKGHLDCRQNYYD